MATWYRSLTAELVNLAGRGDFDATKKEVENGANVNVVGKYEGHSPLLIAARNGYAEIVNYLLANGANVRLANSRGETCLHLCLSGTRGDSKIFELLLNYPKAPITAKTVKGATILHVAITHRRSKAVKAILDHLEGRSLVNVPYTKTNDYPLHYAAKMGSMKIATQLLDKQATVDVTNRSLETPLMWAARLNCTELVALLLQKGANAQLKDHNGNTAADLARKEGSEAALEMLLECQLTHLKKKDVDFDNLKSKNKKVISDDDIYQLTQTGEGRETIVSELNLLDRLIKLAYTEDLRFAEGLATIAKKPNYMPFVVKKKGLTPLLTLIGKDWSEGEKQRWKFVPCPILEMNRDFTIMEPKELNIIGSGGYGNVYKGELVASKHVIAVKSLGSHDLKLLGRETALLGCLGTTSSYFIRCYGFSWVRDSCYFAMEYANRGTLLQLFGKPEFQDMKLRTSIALKVAKAVHFLHDVCELVHRDLKGENILIVENNGKLTPKLSDFGLSRTKALNTADKTFIGGTMGYMPPELFANLVSASSLIGMTNLTLAEQAQDIYALGVVFCEIASQTKAFKDSSMIGVVEKKQKEVEGSFSLLDQLEISGEWAKLIQNCIALQPSARYTAKQVVTHLKTMH